MRAFLQGNGLKLLADGGYKDVVSLVCPDDKKGRSWNNQQKALRSVVEVVIGMVQHYSYAAQKARQTPEFQALALMCCYQLANINLKRFPLHQLPPPSSVISLVEECSKLFPWYFRIGSLCSATLLAIFLSSHADLWQSLRQGNLSAFTQWSDPRVLQVYALAIALLFTLLNQFVVGPKASSVMFQRHKLEKDSIPEAAKEVQLKQLNKTFGMLHGVSSLLNLVTMIAAFIHVLYLSSRINL
ncbi:hypothetical protein QOT17_016292 [Balamuthia mandrillaris]